MKLIITSLLVWLLASLPFVYVLARIIRFGSHDVPTDSDESEPL